jgi:hypothetical protein
VIRRIVLAILVLVMCWFAEDAAAAAEITPPPSPVTGTAMSLATSGSGTATFYLVGPATRIKRSVRLGEPIRLQPADASAAGRYTAIVDGDGGASVSFYVAPSKPAELSFLARPSRVPAATHDGISGVVFAFDRNQNLIIEPMPVRFDLTVAGGTPQARTVETRSGVAYTIVDSGRKEGAAQFVASVGDVTARRVVQQVAADPCNLHFQAERTKDGILVHTDEVRDCSGNPVPDGTIVSFVQVGPRGKDTVDARVKRGVAQGMLPADSPSTISVASGVVSGNEVHIGGGQ